MNNICLVFIIVAVLHFTYMILWKDTNAVHTSYLELIQ